MEVVEWRLRAARRAAACDEWGPGRRWRSAPPPPPPTRLPAWVAEATVADPYEEGQVGGDCPGRWVRRALVGLRTTGIRLGVESIVVYGRLEVRRKGGAAQNWDQYGGSVSLGGLQVGPLGG